MKRARTILFWKPYGVLCQFTPDQPGQRTLAEFGFPKRVFPIGRLDQDSEGLLLLGACATTPSPPPGATGD